jgi:DNA adenine methylase
MRCKDCQPTLTPFLKWAGGKRWLVANHPQLFPRTFARYIEPFLGSGAVYFHLAPKSALIADSNDDLIGVFRAIKKNWKLVESALKRHQRNHDATYYYLERARRHHVGYEKAARFIYLNRTCWNGLHRVNLRGEFNVPVGTKTTVCLDTDAFEAVASLLRKATILVSDFEPIIDKAKEHDFLFIDPPYITRHNFNGFIKYNDKLFSWLDQERLFMAVKRAARRGAKILVTNADHSSIRNLYRNLGTAVSLRRHSILAADAQNRGATTELAIMINYKPFSQERHLSAVTGSSSISQPAHIRQDP